MQWSNGETVEGLISLSPGMQLKLHINGDQIRTLSLDLHSPLLENFGLRVALHRHCKEQADQAGWSMHFDLVSGNNNQNTSVDTVATPSE